MSLLVWRVWQEDYQMVTDKYYEKEVVHQEHINAANNSEAYGEGFKLVKSQAEVNLQIPPALAAGLTEGEMYFYCPSDEKSDKRIPLQANSTGAYTFPTGSLKKTGYVAKVKFKSGGKEYYKEFDVSL